MAKNYSLAEAVQVLLENEDTAAIADIGRRYPLLAVKITRVAVRWPDAVYAGEPVC